MQRGIRFSGRKCDSAKNARAVSASGQKGGVNLDDLGTFQVSMSKTLNEFIEQAP